MTALDGYANFHPFFVHAPLAFIPLALVMTVLGRRNRDAGFNRATLLVTVAAGLTALVAMATGLRATNTLTGAPLGLPLDQHQINGCALGIVCGISALLATGEWLGWLGNRAWWLRAAMIAWCTIGCFFCGHSGAKLVYQHGAAVMSASAR